MMNTDELDPAVARYRAARDDLAHATAALRTLIVAELERGVPPTHLARYTGVSTRTIYKWLRAAR